MFGVKFFSIIFINPDIYLHVDLLTYIRPGAIIKSWDLHAPMIWDNFSLF